MVGKKMRVFFIGTVEFSKNLLQKLIELNVQVVGVCTREKSYFHSDFSDLSTLCEENKIPYKFVKDINSSLNIEWIKSLVPDIIFCFGWSSLIKEELLGLAPMGVVGFHPAKLPQNRGRHPLIWALALGLKKSASTFFFMDEKADSGDILSQKDFNILDTDDARILYNKVLDIALIQLEKIIPQLENKTFKKIKQNHKIANTWRKRENIDSEIDFRMNSKAIYNLVRALAKPYVGAHVKHNGKKIAVWKVKIVENSQNNIEYGKIIYSNQDKIIVKTIDGSIEILEHEFVKFPKVGEYL